MPSSLIIVALVVAWLLVLVPIVARRRQEVTTTADSTLAARVVHSGGVRGTVQEEFSMPDADESDTQHHDNEFGPADPDVQASDTGPEQFDDELDADEYASDEFVDEEEFDEAPRRYRPGRGGFDPEAAAEAARAKYAFRQRVVVFMLLVAIVTAALAVLTTPLFWWPHGALDLGVVGYLSYLRRQVRIEEEIRDRRAARLGATARHFPEPVIEQDDDRFRPVPAPRRPTAHVATTRQSRPSTVVVDMDDEDPMFDELAEPDVLLYRRAVGE